MYFKVYSYSTIIALSEKNLNLTILKNVVLNFFFFHRYWKKTITEEEISSWWDDRSWQRPVCSTKSGWKWNLLPLASRHPHALWYVWHKDLTSYTETFTYKHHQMFHFSLSCLGVSKSHFIRLTQCIYIM